MTKITAILSTTVIPIDGNYEVKNAEINCNNGWLENLCQGVPHYVGHPDTKAIIESLGSVQAESKLFTGLQVNERALCFAIKQGLSSRAKDGFTSQHQSVTLADLSVKMITRIK